MQKLIFRKAKPKLFSGKIKASYSKESPKKSSDFPLHLDFIIDFILN
jgi:hypothetical protein